ncbi:MAG: hypothetical protein HQM04_06925 [Magnetococcales bacterium]|nr:hypothetical protein [Magnetococcales bacterium]MBF0114761.1 hypothetical protein [Magnetococcales bacterium]
MAHAQPHTEEYREPVPPQTVEDWLFAYANARTENSRAVMWPHLVEAVEELIADSRRLYAQQQKRASSAL